jgi:hypothetical protein
MWKYAIKQAFYKGKYTECVLEDCINSKCTAVNLRYPTNRKEVTCPICKTVMLASKFRKLQYDRKAYHLKVPDALINRVIKGTVNYV